MASREPVARVILLGASNLRAGLPIVLDEIRRNVAGPAEVLTACGHGRSYGAWSRFLFVRRLPGILGCGLWQSLEGRPPLRTLALVTDVGNDLVYGVGVETITAWIETCLERLARHQAEVVLTLLPISRLEKLSSREVRLASSLLFPGRPAPWPELLDRARELDERVRRLGRSYGIRLAEPEAGWYGFDPIHLRRSVRRQAWNGIVSLWPAGPEAQRPPYGRIQIPLLGAAEVNLLGFRLRTLQPAMRLLDGTTVAFY